MWKRLQPKFSLSFLLILVFVSGVVSYWTWTRPRQYAARQLAAARSLIHVRDQSYLTQVFDETAKRHLVTILGDSRMTH